MPNLGLHAGRGVQAIALAALFIAGVAYAQLAPAAPQDPFAGLHARLVGAADKALAEVLSDRPWMKTGTSEGGAERQTIMDGVQRLGAAVQRVQQLRPLVEPILHAEGIPPELIAVALVESGGQTMALSPKGARGVWQFMPDTARRYGLAVSAERDERVEVVKSTRAAGRYLHDLYEQFGNWPLALAAYNAGERAIQQAVARSGQRDYPSIERSLPLETRNYVPAVISAMRLFAADGPNLEQVGKTGSRRGNVLYASAQSSE